MTEPDTLMAAALACRQRNTQRLHRRASANEGVVNLKAVERIKKVFFPIVTPTLLSGSAFSPSPSGAYHSFAVSRGEVQIASVAIQPRGSGQRLA